MIWERLRGTPFSVERLQPAVFVHFGSSREYWHMTAGDPELADLCGWTTQAAAWIGGESAQYCPACAGQRRGRGPGPHPVSCRCSSWTAGWRPR